MTILRDLLISSIHEGRQSMGYDKCLGLLTVRHLDGHAEEADAILLTPSCQALQQRLDALDAAEAREKVLREALRDLADFVDAKHPTNPTALYLTQKARAALAAHWSNAHS